MNRIFYASTSSIVFIKLRQKFQDIQIIAYAVKTISFMAYRSREELEEPTYLLVSFMFVVAVVRCSFPYNTERRRNLSQGCNDWSTFIPKHCEAVYKNFPTFWNNLSSSNSSLDDFKMTFYRYLWHECFDSGVVGDHMFCETLHVGATLGMFTNFQRVTFFLVLWSVGAEKVAYTFVVDLQVTGIEKTIIRRN